ncbi:MAG: hypothetical protein SF028_11160 [Candidatus Sumerlaeia bacterium]|nr:hypothetical protein [Candidatus Sumerlaeia bacterium]
MTSPTAAKATPALDTLRRAAILVACAALLALALVHHPVGGWNVNSRLALVAAVANNGDFKIDPWHNTRPYQTGDKAFFGGHYYSDKIFGVSLLAVPPAWVLARLGAELPFDWWHHAMRLWAVALPAALSVGLLFAILGRLGVPPRRALLAALLPFFGSMWFGYSTVFYPYAPGIACQLGALWLILFPPARRMTHRGSAAIGFLLGYSWLCDQIFGIGSALLAGVYFLRLLDQGGIWGQRAFAEMAGLRSNPRQLVLLALAFWAAAFVSPGLYAAYTWSIFGEVVNPYAHHADPLFRERMAQGLMGIGAPSLDVLWFITLHPARGLFFWSPVLLLAAVGCALGVRQDGKRRLLGWLGLAYLAGYLLLNSGYYMWWGGWAMGPRFLIPAIPFLALGLGEVLRLAKPAKKGDDPPPAHRWGLPALVATGVASLALSLPLSLSDPQMPQGGRAEEFFAATVAHPPPTTLGAYAKSFWKMEFTPWLGDRLMRRVYAPNAPKGRQAAGWLLWLLAALAPAALAWRLLPRAPLFARIDYPMKTSDGSLGPPPPS